MLVAYLVKIRHWKLHGIRVFWAGQSGMLTWHLPSPSPYQLIPGICDLSPKSNTRRMVPLFPDGSIQLNICGFEQICETTCHHGLTLQIWLRHNRQCCLGTTSHKGQDALRLSYSFRDLEWHFFMWRVSNGKIMFPDVLETKPEKLA